ncbi:MAG: D-xylose transporter subunit XylF [Gammaproteobacteria bacterium]|nr:MAG: D-xylose transporter subunit XylF [Gammaproteobacteria bacterium]
MRRRTFSLMVHVTVFLMLTLALLPYSGPKDAEAQNMKIGFILKTMQEERYQIDKTAFIVKAKELGAEVLFNSSRNDELVQLQQVEKMLDEGIQVLVLQPVNTGTAGNLVRLAHEKGIKVIGYDSMLQNGPLDMMVMQDSWAVGKLQGEAMVKWFQEKKGSVEGKVALIMGQPEDANAAAMSEGVLKTLEEYPDLELIAQRSHEGWSPDLARETTETLLVKYDNKIDAFVCNNSGLASGVIAALDLEGLADAENVFVAGSDADLRNIQYIVQGKQVVEILKKIQPLAFKAVEIAVAMIENPYTAVAELPEAKGCVMINNGFMDVPTIITPVVLVTEENLDSTVIRDVIIEKFYTKEQVYGSEE